MFISKNTLGGPTKADGGGRWPAVVRWQPGGGPTTTGKYSSGEGQWPHGDSMEEGGGLMAEGSVHWQPNSGLVVVGGSTVVEGNRR